MSMSWELLLLRNIPREGDGGDNGNTGPGGANSPGDTGNTASTDGASTTGNSTDTSAADISASYGDFGGDPLAGVAGALGTGTEGFAGVAGSDSGVSQIGGGPNAVPGFGPGALAEAAANIANTSGSPEAAMANAAATGNAAIADAVASMVGAAAAATGSSSIASAAAGVSPTVSLGYGGFSTANVSQGAKATGVADIGAPSMSGTPSISGGLGSLSGLGGLGTAPAAGTTAVTGTTGLAELGDTGPQGFSTSGFAPSSTAPDVSLGMAAVGMPADQASFAADLSNVGSSLAQAAATPAEGLSDIGIADPSGLGTGFTGFGTGTVSISPSIDAAVQAVSTFGAQNVGAYSMPGYSTPAASVSMPTGNQAFSVGYAGTPSVTNVAAQDVAAQRSGITSLSAQQLSDQLNSMTQPSALSNVGATPTAPAVSSYGFSGMTSAGLPGIAGLAGAPAPTSSSSLATAAAVSPSTSAPAATQGSTPTRSASSISAEDVAQPGWGHTAATVAANAALAAFGGIPGLAAQGASYIGTGQSVGANLADVALGGGFAPPGGLLGGGFSGIGLGGAYGGGQPAAIGTGSSDGGIATLVEPTVAATTGEVINPAAVQRQPANPYGFNVSDFVTRYDPRNYSDYLPVQGYRA